MRKHLRWVLGLLLAACGDSGEDPGITAEEVAAQGTYCCFENGVATSDSAEACTKSTRGCVWSETYDNVDAAGRGRMCGYLACR